MAFSNVKSFTKCNEENAKPWLSHGKIKLDILLIWFSHLIVKHLVCLYFHSHSFLFSSVVQVESTLLLFITKIVFLSRPPQNSSSFFYFFFWFAMNVRAQKCIKKLKGNDDDLLLLSDKSAWVGACEAYKERNEKRLRVKERESEGVVCLFVILQKCNRGSLCKKKG